MKNLYVLISDSGDGSYHAVYTMDADLIKEVEENEDLMDEYDPGFDGDGFHYDVISIPDECTYESLGIRSPLTRKSFVGLMNL